MAYLSLDVDPVDLAKKCVSIFADSGIPSSNYDVLWLTKINTDSVTFMLSNIHYTKKSSMFSYHVGCLTAIALTLSFKGYVPCHVITTKGTPKAVTSIWEGIDAFGQRYCLKAHKAAAFEADKIQVLMGVFKHGAFGPYVRTEEKHCRGMSGLSY